MLVRGTLMHTPVPGDVEIIEDAFVAVNSDGTISSVDTGLDPSVIDKSRADGTLIELSDDQVLLPGLVDLHIHAPQWPQMGKALHLPLDVWLQKYTFPLEARYDDVAFATRSYESLVDNLLANGTTTATLASARP